MMHSQKNIKLKIVSNQNSPPPQTLLSPSLKQIKPIICLSVCICT